MPGRNQLYVVLSDDGFDVVQFGIGKAVVEGDRSRFEPDLRLRVDSLHVKANRLITTKTREVGPAWTFIQCARHQLGRLIRLTDT